MATVSVWQNIEVEEARLVPTLQETGAQLDSAEGEVVLDFSNVRRLDTAALTALAELADAADEKAVTVALRGVNIDVYKVLKLVKLSRRFTFAV